MTHVQLRDEHHTVLPGIELGDVGPKLGQNMLDTGNVVRHLRLAGCLGPNCVG